jgi:ABC-type branched-subunit amino acid transport system substrate-binding protein
MGGYEAVDAYIKDVNSKGGVNGYKFDFVGIDDGGDA